MGSIKSLCAQCPQNTQFLRWKKVALFGSRSSHVCARNIGQWPDPYRIGSRRTHRETTW